MSKEQILNRLNELEAERQELIAEQHNIDSLQNFVISDDASRADEFRHMLQRRQADVNMRARKWEIEVDKLEKEADALAA